MCFRCEYIVQCDSCPECCVSRDGQRAGRVRSGRNSGRNLPRAAAAASVRPAQEKASVPAAPERRVHPHKIHRGSLSTSSRIATADGCLDPVRHSKHSMTMIKTQWITNSLDGYSNESRAMILDVCLNKSLIVSVIALRHTRVCFIMVKVTFCKVLLVLKCQVTEKSFIYSLQRFIRLELSHVTLYLKNRLNWALRSQSCDRSRRNTDLRSELNSSQRKNTEQMKFSPSSGRFCLFFTERSRKRQRTQQTLDVSKIL